MLAQRDAMATIAVRNLEKSRTFYEKTLGLTPTEEDNPGVAVYQSGHTRLVVYQSDYAGTNKATAATWGVGDEIDAEVRRLKKAGVSFEHYDLPGMELQGDLHTAGGFKAAWFKDPDGNILHINNQD